MAPASGRHRPLIPTYTLLLPEGGVSRVILSPDLVPERSQSISGSVNFDKPAEHFIAGFTVEGFYTRLNDAFFLQPIGEDGFGELFEKQNGQGATVQWSNC
jgi:outer membrane receptor for ferrienterochelin and colicins